MEAAKQTLTASGKFANDGSYESVERMLRKQASLYFRRAEAQGLPMTMDDAMGEVNLAYVKARQAWNPEGGARFSTYLHTTCRNEWNSRTAKMARDRAELGLSSVDDVTCAEDGDADGDGYERLLVEEETFLDRVVRSEEVLERLAQLSRPAKLFVARLLATQTAGSADMTLPEIAASIGAVGGAALEIQRELRRVYGVNVMLSARRKGTAE